MNKKRCVLCRNLISIYIRNRTFHGRLGIRILSSRAESISHSFASLTRERYFQHSKIKFVSPRGHEISSISVNIGQSSRKLPFCVQFLILNMLGNEMLYKVSSFFYIAGAFLNTTHALIG